VNAAFASLSYCAAAAGVSGASASTGGPCRGERDVSLSASGSRAAPADALAGELAAWPIFPVIVGER
jgi:hypothetical protein